MNGWKIQNLSKKKLVFLELLQIRPVLRKTIFVLIK
jgi:hypothetical protein